MSKGAEYVWGIVMGVAVTVILFTSISTYNDVLLDRGFAEYNSTNGDFQLKGCDNG